MRRRPAPLSIALVALATLPCALADAGDDAARLERVEARLRKVAVEATPKTVCLRVERAKAAVGFGSGALISADGLLLTCAHVTEPAAGGRLVAIFPDGREEVVALVASNAHNDLSLCRLEGETKDLPHFELAEADPAVGDWVMALGHPGGPYADHRPTVTAGKVVGLHRELAVWLAGKEYVDATQMDAPIFGGNSGGPLVDLDGRLVGINGAALAVGDAGFASSVAQIRRDLPTLREGKAPEPRKIGDVLGSMTRLTEELDPETMANAFADERLNGLLRTLAMMRAGAGDDDDEATPAKPHARRRREEIAAAYAGTPATSPGRAAELLREGRRIGFAVPWSPEGGHPRFVTAGRLVAEEGEVRVRWTPPGGTPVEAAARVRGVDGAYDVALLDLPTVAAAPGGPPAIAAEGDASPGSFVLLPDADGGLLDAGIVCARDRVVGTERRVPTLGIVKLFQPPNSSPFRPYPAMVQVDATLERDQFGGPVLRPDGGLVGLAVAHFNRGATMLVPAAALVERVERLAKGLDAPAPPVYGPEPRPVPDRTPTPKKVRAATLILYVPTLSGVLRPARVKDAPKGEASLDGPTALEDSGGGALDLRQGDVLVSIGGTPTPTVEAAKAAIGTLAAQGRTAVVLRRGATVVTYDAVLEPDAKQRPRLVLRAIR